MTKNLLCDGLFDIDLKDLRRLKELLESNISCTFNQNNVHEKARTNYGCGSSCTGSCDGSCDGSCQGQCYGCGKS